MFVGPTADAHGEWQISHGWTREFDEQGEVSKLTPISGEMRVFEPATYYGIEQPEPKFMRLGSDTGRLSGSRPALTIDGRR